MIVYISGRTDIVQYYSEWMMKRFEEGYFLSRNPIFQNKVTRYELSPEKVDCIVFCSKDYRPLLPRIREITDRFHTYFHYTITPYEKDIEPGVPALNDSIQTLKELSDKVGKERIAWRYDPILLTKKYTVTRHLEQFEQLARPISRYVSCCLFNFVEEHRSLLKNLPELIPLTPADQQYLAAGFADIAAHYRLPLQSCSANGDYNGYGISSCGCVNLETLGQANNVRFRSLKHKGTRPGCQKIETRDPDANYTCQNGCRYCYANPSPVRSAENILRHDPASPLLIGHVRPTDTIQAGVQRSFLKRN